MTQIKAQRNKAQGNFVHISCDILYAQMLMLFIFVIEKNITINCYYYIYIFINIYNCWQQSISAFALELPLIYLRQLYNIVRHQYQYGHYVTLMSLIESMVALARNDLANVAAKSYYHQYVRGVHFTNDVFRRNPELEWSLFWPHRYF